MQNNQNTNILIVGKTRSGKSYASGRLGELITDAYNDVFHTHKTFSADVNVVWDIMDLIDRMSELEKNAVICIEELGTQFSPQDWAKIQNRVFNRILQTQGKRMIVFIMTTPHISFVQKCNLHLITYIVRMLYANKHLKFSSGIIYVNKIYAHLYDYDRVKGLWQMFFQMPSDKFIEDYEKMKDKYLDLKLPEWKEEIQAMMDREKRSTERYKKEQDPYLP